MTRVVNLTVDIKLDESGRPSTKPEDVLTMTQQLMMKTLLEQTNNGEKSPVDIKESLNLIREINNAALTTRKLDQEERGLSNQKDMLEMFKQMETHFQGKNLYAVDNSSRTSDPYSGLEPPQIHVREEEISQGENTPSADDFIPED